MTRTKAFATALAGLFALGVVHSANAGLINGNFEVPVWAPGGGPAVSIVDASFVPGWHTTATDNMIEIWSNGFGGVISYDGNQHAELNATQASTLFQDASGIAAGSLVGFQFAHRARVGTDVMRFTLTDLGVDGLLGGVDDTVLFTQLYSDDTSAWGFYTGNGIVALGNTVRFSFQAVSTGSGNATVGNFLDDADFGVGVGNPVPEPASLALLGLGLFGLGWSRRKKT